MEEQFYVQFCTESDLELFEISSMPKKSSHDENERFCDSKVERIFEGVFFFCIY